MSRGAYCARALALALATALAPAAAPAAAAAAAVEPACASPQLPPAILQGAFAAERPLRVVRVRAPAAALQLAVAADAHAREIGLMCVLGLRPRSGMIFVFAATQYWDFWMKNTLVPLDMVWLDDAGIVTSVSADVPASTRATPDADVARRVGYGRYTVELRAGEAARDGLVPGAKLRLPALRASQ